MRLVAVILAGGRGERLGGVVKANIEIGGQTLLHRVTAALRTPPPILVVHGRIAAADLRLEPQHLPLADLDVDAGGPLLGLATAVAWCSALPEPPEAIVTVAVDTPYLPADYTERLDSALTPDTDAVVARYAGHDYPTNAIWRLAAVTGLPASVAAGTAPHSLRRLAADLAAPALDWPATPTGDPFANVNTPDDLRAMTARAAASRSPPPGDAPGADFGVGKAGQTR